MAANITVTTQDDCNDSSTSNEIDSVAQTQSINNAKVSVSEAINCVQIPVDQGPSYQSDTLTVGTPVTLMNDIQSKSPSMIAFPQLQSIRFVHSSFHPGQTNSNSVPIPIQTKPNPSPQLGVVGTQDEAVVQISSANIVGRSNAASNNVIPRGQMQSIPVCVPSPNQGRGQNAIVVQQQAPIAPIAQPRQIVTAAVQPQYPTAVTTSSRTARPTTQGGQRGSRSGNKEQGGGRSRSSTKEPPGAVNLERSYQICQAVGLFLFTYRLRE